MGTSRHLAPPVGVSSASSPGGLAGSSSSRPLGPRPASLRPAAVQSGRHDGGGGGVSGGDNHGDTGYASW